MRIKVIHQAQQLVVVIIFLSCLSGCQTKKDEPAKPNVLFILADDFGYHDMSSSGSEFYETPHMDRIAVESMVFTQGYAACQVCSPSRASIMPVMVLRTG